MPVDLQANGHYFFVLEFIALKQKRRSNYYANDHRH